MVRVLATSAMIVIMVMLMPVLKRRISADTYRRFCAAAFAFYILLYLYTTLLSRTPAKTIQTEFEWFRACRRSFKLEDDIVGTIRRLFTEGPTAGIHLVSTELLEGVLLNILLYVPMGYLLPMVFGRLREKGFWYVLLIGFTVSLLTELTQLISRLGWFDMDDIMNNVAGTCMGMMIFRWQNRVHDRK